jgi:tetratricopeptide (TPR) repeat protein
MISSAGAIPTSSSTNDQICDPEADYYLGMEDYPKAIQLHREVIRRHPNLALAYYHLGFAYGVLGDHTRELNGYERAVELGLSDWALFLNLGRLYLETNRLEQASDAFRLAALLGPYHYETHYNLGLVYERMGRFDRAEQEILLALRLRPDEPDALNTLGLIFAERGNYNQARAVWTELNRKNPQYEPARANLAVLQRIESGSSRQAGSFAQAP